MGKWEQVLPKGQDASPICPTNKIRGEKGERTMICDYDEYCEGKQKAFEREQALSRTSESAGWVDCVGVDGKKHIFQPQDETTKCGVKIARKKLGKTDWNRFSCYDCTY